MAKTVIRLFDDYSEAQRAVADLRKHGFDRDDISITRETDSPTALEVMTEARVPEQDLRSYTMGVRQGGTLVLVRTEKRKAKQAADILSRYNMVDVDACPAETRQAGVNDMQVSALDQDSAVIPIVEEELQVGKREVQGGGVHVHTHVTERPVEEQVTLRDETVRVERRPVDRPVSDADAMAFKEQEFELTETNEEAVIQKRARVIEEVVVGKQVEEHTETIRDTVRRTDVDVEQVGVERAVGVSGYDAYDADFRNHFQTTYANSGYTYDEYATTYRYGYNLANSERTRGKDWNAVETNARQTWEERNPGTWEEFKDSVRYAWEKARGKR
jgi:uncharacterized protein (TIGR02271 family)